MVANRIGLLTARVVTSVEVFEFLRHMETLLGASQDLKRIIMNEEKYHQGLIAKNKAELAELAKKYKSQYDQFQEDHARQLISTFAVTHS